MSNLKWYPYSCYTVFYYLSFISKLKLTFYNRDGDHTYRHMKVARSWPYIVLPTIIMILFGVRGLTFLLRMNWFDTPEKRISIFTELLPEKSRVAMEITLFVATIMKVGYVVYVLRERLFDYRFLAIFAVDQQGEQGIKPKLLDLTEDELAKFTKLRAKYLPIANTVSAIVTILAILASVFQIFNKSLWQVHLGYTIFSLLLWMFWLVQVCDFVYGMPTFMTILFSYIQIKQKTVLSELTDLTQCKVRLPRHLAKFYLRVRRQYYRYSWITREVKDYNRFSSRFLTHFMATFIINVTYISYALFLTQTTLDFRILYSSVWMGHVTMLSAVILSAAAVQKKHKMVSHGMYRVLCRAHRLNQFSAHRLLKVGTFVQVLSRRKVGFSLANSYVINYYTYPAVIYFISLFFFLIIKKGNLIPIY